MGGFGSGRGQRGKDTTSDMRALDIRKLQRDGLLTPGRAFGWHCANSGTSWTAIPAEAGHRFQRNLDSPKS